MEDFTLKKLNEKQIKLKIQELKEEFKKKTSFNRRKNSCKFRIIKF